MTEQNLTMRDLVDELIKKYNFENEPTFRGTLRKKIRRVCEEIKVDVDGKTNLWELVTFPKGKTTEHIFTYGQKQLLFNQVNFQQFLYENCIDEEKKMKIDENIKHIEKSKIINQEELAYMESNTYGNTNENLMLFYDDKDVINKKTEIMIEAIFKLLFKPIDEKLLRADMETCTGVAGTTDHTAETELATKRLNNHEYCNLKPEIEELFKKLKK